MGKIFSNGFKAEIEQKIKAGLIKEYSTASIEEIERNMEFFKDPLMDYILKESERRMTRGSNFTPKKKKRKK